MSPPADSRFPQFFQELRRHLKLSPDQSREVLEELETHARAQLDAALAEGLSWEDATARVAAGFETLSGLGREISDAVPPKGTKLSRGIRRSLAILVGLWMFYMVWGARGWSMGFHPHLYVFLISFHLPLVWALWPDLIWTKNRTATVLTVIGTAILLSALSIGSSSTIGQPGTPPPPPDYRYLMVALGGAVLTLSFHIQRPAQRLKALLLPCLIVTVSTEIPYQLEEYVCRTQATPLQSFCEEFRTRHGTFPTSTDVKRERPELFSKRWTLLPRYVSLKELGHAQEGYAIRWTRSLFAHFTIKVDEQGRWTVED